jgi:hypothetical protein
MTPRRCKSVTGLRAQGPPSLHQRSASVPRASGGLCSMRGEEQRRVQLQNGQIRCIRCHGLGRESAKRRCDVRAPLSEQSQKLLILDQLLRAAARCRAEVRVPCPNNQSGLRVGKKASALVERDALYSSNGAQQCSVDVCSWAPNCPSGLSKESKVSTRSATVLCLGWNDPNTGTA